MKYGIILLVALLAGCTTNPPIVQHDLVKLSVPAAIAQSCPPLPHVTAIPSVVVTPKAESTPVPASLSISPSVDTNAFDMGQLMIAYKDLQQQYIGCATKDDKLLLIAIPPQ